MVHEKHLEESKLIAEFLGWKKSLGITYHKDKKVTTKKYFDFANNNNWNGLMEVIEKIEGLNYSLEINKQEELDYQCLITQKNNIIIQKFNPIKNQAVYQAVVEFINQLKNI